ncbi:unnamed protein product [Ectocarpus sp. CCAP 1310/34]|nr:unnamed protein product [Ectocarpus sp. CCAP 1310/34]
MKNSSISLLLAAAAATSALASSEPRFEHAPPDPFNGRGGGHHDHDSHDRVQHHHPRHAAGNEQTHQMLKEHVLRGAEGPAIATAGGGSGVGLKADGDAELLHPLAHYLLGFFEWTYKYGRSWGSVHEAFHALQNYARADDKIALHNHKDAGYTIAHNAYSHMSWQEFREHFSIGKDMVVPPDQLPAEFALRPRGEKAPKDLLRGAPIPDEVDWVAKGAVTPVKNQGSCGSCWSFSTTGSMEGAHFIKYGNLAVLSEQELVDCDTYDMGCNGGLMDYSFHWIQQNGGICSEEDYPYTAEGDLCKKSTCDVVEGTMVDRWIDVETDDEQALMEAVAQQPVSIAIEADQMSFQLYSGGVLTAACGTNLDHGVLLVGYGVSEDGVKYWKVKNSWGPEWGAEGYILLKREADQEGGECGILEQASYPVLA